MSEHGDLDRIGRSRNRNGARREMSHVRPDRIERRDGCDQRTVEMFRLSFQLGGDIAVSPRNCRDWDSLVETRPTTAMPKWIPMPTRSGASSSPANCSLRTSSPLHTSRAA